MLALAVVSLLAAHAAAQVDVTASGGTPAASYATLKGAFDAVNAGTHQGVIGIALSGDTNEGTATAALNASGAGAASYTSVTISPTGGAARTVSGATTAGNPMIDLNGADNVTINGLNAGGNALIIANTTVSATSGTSTIRFQADATNNIITNASILGSSTMATTTNGGNIWFGAGAVSTGNDNNTISNCNIGPAGANLPTKAVYGNGSTTTTTLYNSGIILTNNNVYDYFNAAAQSNGVYLAGGNSDWTISNNRFYQTATRTQTTGAIHSAIQVANANNNNHLISGNTIGYSSGAGTGTYSLVGVSASSKFLPIYFSSAGTTTASSIQGNTITAISLSGVVGGTGTSGAFVGISIASGVANIGNVAGNTVGSASAPGAVSLTSTNASAMEVYGIYYFPSATANVSNNTVAGLAATNSGAGSLTLYGIRAFTSSSVVNTMQNNTVGSAAAPITNTSASTASRTIGMYCQSGSCFATGNTVSNLSMSAANAGTGSSASVIGLWVDNTSATTGNNVAQNTVRALSNNDATAAVWVTGLQYNGPTTGTHVVQRNFIHTLSTPSTSATATINGINVQGGLTSYQNNMIALGAGITANSPQINGINETVAGTDNFYHNSVYIGGSGVAAGSASSFAFQSAITLNTRNYVDNIFVNARSNAAATGKHYAVRVGGTAPSPAGLTSNFNVLYAPGSGGNVGLFNLVDQPTLGAWQAATGQDGSSLSSDPQYASPAAATPDLHINPALTTPIEGNGSLVASVSDDYDGQTRSALTPTDIGADAGNFIGVDLAPPVIAYTPLGNTSSTANRTLTTTITDASGVPTAGVGLPVIYYRKGISGAYTGNACAFVSGSSYGCLIDYSAVGGVSAGDTIQYYVAAQDSVGNVTANPSAGAGGFSSNPPAAATPPTTPASYLIAVAYTGTRSVCASGCDFTTLTGAGGVFAALNAGVLTGNLVVEIGGDLTAGEDGSVALNALTEEPAASNFTLRIYPTGAPRAITSTTAPSGGFIRLNGSDRVTLDGSLGGTGTDRSLTITDTNTGASSAVIWLQSNGSDGATGNTLANLNVVGNSNTTTLIGIGMGGATVGTSSLGTGNSNNTVRNNAVSRVQYGIYSQGASAANKNTGNIFTRNVMNAAAPDNVAKGGLWLGFENAVQVTYNTVDGVTQAGSPDVFGIALGLTSISTSSFTGNEVTSATVTHNTIGKVTNTGTFSAAGITLASATSGTTLIADNFIHGVGANGTSPDFGAGILVGGGTGSSAQVYFNSVSLTGAFTGGAYPNYGLAIGGSDPVVDVRDNVFYNTQTNGTGVSFALGTASGTFTNLTSNHNDLYVTPGGGTFKIGKIASLAQGSGTELTLLTDWQSATGKDAASISGDPLFISTSDLHINVGGPPSPVEGAATPLAAVTTDFDGDARSATAPTIGADEVLAVAGLTATPGNAQVQLNWSAVTGAASYNVKRGTASGGPYSTIANVATNSHLDTAVSNGTTYYYVVTALGVGPEGRRSNEATATPQGPPPAPTGLVAAPGNAQVALTWSAVAGADSYNVKRALVSGGPYATIASGVLTSNYTDTGVTNGTTYFYVVSGVSNVGGEGPNSSQASATPVAPPPAPTGLSATPGNAQVALSWSAAAGADTYNVKRALVSGGPYATVVSGVVPTGHTDTGLTNGTTYFYVVSGVNAGGEGPDSSEASATPQAPLADVAVSATTSNATPGVGQNVTLTITVSNAGPTAASGLIVTDRVPAGLTFVSATPSAGTYNSGTGAWSVGTLANGASATLQLVATAGTTAAIVNKAAKTAQNEPDPDPSNNAASTGLNAGSLTDIRLQMTVDDAVPVPSQSVTFTIVATNRGPSSATGLAVTDLLPGALTYVSSTPSTGSYTPGTGVWAIGTLASGASATLQLVASVGSSGTIANVAAVSAVSPSDPDASNDAASVVLNAGGEADLALDKSGSPDPTPSGGKVTYLITVSNLGPAAATGVTVSDTLPAGLSSVVASTSQGSCTGVATITCNLGGLPPGASALVRIDATKSVAGSLTLNTAGVNATESDPYLANNSNTAPITPVELQSFQVE